MAYAAFKKSLSFVSKAIIILLPIIVTFSLIVTSFINGNTKALFFIFGALLLYGLNLFFVDYLIGKSDTFDEIQDIAADALTALAAGDGGVSSASAATFNLFLSKMFKWEGIGIKKTPSFAVTFMSFVLMYLCLPLKNLPRDTQFPLLMVFVLVILTISSIIVSFNVSAIPVSGANIGVHALAVAIGMGWGAAWFGIIKGKKDNPSGRTYFSANSADSVKCSRPSTQAFKCTVYKDGKPVGDINT